jgi:diguanylate cyclase (GGDEF)-like protein/PAS domain S-box-containing protein
MRLKRKILLMIIGILAVSLLVSSLLAIQSFRKHYTDVLITGSFTIGRSLESLLEERLAQGQALKSVSGINRKLSQVVNKNQHIDYAFVMDPRGVVVFHSQPDLTGRLLHRDADRRALQARHPFWQDYASDDGRDFIDVSLPLSDQNAYVGVIRLGFHASVIEDAMASALQQLLLIASVTFLLIGLVLNIYLRRQVVEPINQLSQYADSIAKGVPYHKVHLKRGDEIGSLSGALVRMSATFKQQIEALKCGGQILEEKVHARTRQLARTNQVLERSNNDLKQALQRERGLSEALRTSEERFRMLFEQNKAVMLILDPEDGKLLAANQAAEEYYGYSETDLLQMKISDINTLSQNQVSQEMKRAQQEERNHFYFRHLLACGEQRDVEVHSGPIQWDDRLALYSIVHDVTDRKQAEAELKHIAHYDALTGLPNRLLKTDRLRQAMTRCRRNATSVAVCYMDLDGFKPINDRYGHDVGDKILIETAHRLLATVREGDTVSRIGGDEFVLILADLEGDEQCRLILDRVLAAIALPIVIDDQVLEVRASIGVTLYPQDDADADILLRHADQSMYLAKNSGKGRFHFFDPVESRQVRAHKEKLHRLSQALAEDEFELHFQPKVNMLTSEVVGMEALIRWNHPEKGLLSPGDFLYHLVDTPLEIDVGQWVIKRALQQQSTLRASGLALPVSVNISANHLQTPGFVKLITRLLEETPLHQQGDLEFEILESSSIEDMSDIFHTLVSCHDLGIRFSLDDFGTGYSSLAYFHRLPVDSLKIDQTFVQDMLEDPQDLTIVDSVIRLAGAFRHPVIAEGVESIEHASALLRLGCRLGQGYGIARPMPMEELIDWKQTWDQHQEWRNLKYRFASEEGIDIQAAIASHRAWIDNMMTLLRNEKNLCSKQLDSRHCTFGRWFHSVGYFHYGHLQVYEVIREQHELVHDLGRELCDLSSNGFRQEALSRLPELEVARDRFADLVGELKVFTSKSIDMSHRLHVV